MRKENSEFKTAFVSEAGSFIDNRDYFAFVELDDMACYVIADGLDTDRELRSAEMVVKAILESFMEKPSMSTRKLHRDLQSAHEWLKFESQRVRLKASVLVIVTNYTKLIWASCGNARLYHFRSGRLNLKSRDQSLSQLLLDSGKISEQGFSYHEERGNLLQYMGKPDQFEPYISKKIPLQDSDVLLLCTPGIWKQVEQSEMIDALSEASEPDVLTDTLEEIVLSKQEQTVHNYTAAAIYINKIFQEKPKNIKKWAKRIAIMAISAILMGGGIWYMYYRQAQQIATAVVQMTESEQDGDGYAQAGDYAKALKAYSEAKNAASKVKDKVHFQLLRNKQRVAQNVVDGDGYVKDSKYDMAKDSYNKALEEAPKYKVFKQEHIQAKLERTDAIATLNDVIKNGDKQFQDQDYYTALKTYQRAKTAAIEAEYESGQKQMEKKIQETQDKIDSINKETKTLQADNLEKKGDKSMSAMDYSMAITAYTSAQEIYQEIEKLERVLAMERKISKANDKLSPVTPASTDNSGNGTGNSSDTKSSSKEEKDKENGQTKEPNDETTAGGNS
ncbi:serine/threonine protein phosphatase PrpC [Paenibacillus turicensis]|uniref:Serine/threonine protein phosphatase PrpC n=1 Tax=Paenibacillus turicensis TaxID=160487 RepID=A0ABS4FS86_9BACL|nr:serine/threonine protein phosphatase [Paenibacillus turicensis]MBP1905435.1 serine/threonine protein phosphatase PrpC [Paenibacillus turicensis]